MSPKSRLLCAALGVLAEDAYVALGGRERVATVGHLAAQLSLLTKIDDEVIDAKAFHGGPLRTSGHAQLRRTTAAYLQPTLDSLRNAEPVNGEARCELAATIGRGLRQIAGHGDRLPQLLDVIARGWEVQVRAVDVLSRHPGETSLGQVRDVTAAISGDWLLMITMVGTVAAEVQRPMSQAEQDAFRCWGWHIQRADALADFEKDTRAGLSNSWAGRTLFARRGDRYLEALRVHDFDTLYGMLRASRSDRACLPDVQPDESLGALRTPLRALGPVPDWLWWIHGMLTARYVHSDRVRGGVSDDVRAFARTESLNLHGEA